MSFSLAAKVFDSKVHESYIRFLFKNLYDLKTYRFALYNFVLNNLRMRYRRSALGFVWSLLNPLLVMAVISVVFSLIFKQDIRIFAVYIFSGLAPWGYINQAIQGGSQSIILSEGFLKKVYLPKLLFPVISVTTETVNFLFSLTSLYILALILGSPFTWRVLLLPLAILVTYIFVLGCATILSVVTVYFRDLTQIISVVFTALFYLIPILYPLETIPEQYRALFYINPFFYFVMLFRKVIYAEQAMFLMDWIIPLIIALVVFAISILVLLWKDRDIVYRL